MPLFSNMGLQKRIVLFIGFGLVAVFGLFGYLGLQAIQRSTDFVYRERLDLAKAVANDLDNAVIRSVKEIERLAASDTFNLEDRNLEPEKAELQDIYQDFSAHHDWAFANLNRIRLVDASGIILWTEPFSPQLIGRNAYSDDTVRESLEKASIVVGRSGPANEPILPIAVPVKNKQDKLTGAIIADIDPTQAITALSQSFSRDDLPEVEVINEKGIVMATFGPDLLFEKSHHADLVSSYIAKWTPGVVVHTIPGYSEWDHMVIFAPLKVAPWAVMLEQPKDAALALPNELRRDMLLFGGIALVLTLGSAWFLTRSIVKPLKSLTSAVQKIPENDFSEPIAPLGRDEIGLLARAFEEMRVKLRASQAEIADWNHQLESRVEHRTREIHALIEASQALASTLNQDALFDTIIAETREVFPAASAAALLLPEANENTLEVRASFGLSPDFASGGKLRSDEGCIGEVFRSGEALICESDLCTRMRAGVNTQLTDGVDAGDIALCVPLIYQKHTVGCLVAYNATGADRISESDVELMKALTNQAAIAIENARLFKEASLAVSLQELDRLKTEFVARASHELRAPLASAKSLAETLLRPDLSLRPAVRREFLEGIDTACDRLASIIDDLLTISRIESGRVEFRFQTAFLGPLIERVVTQFNSPALARNIVVERMDGLPPASVDPQRLEQILTNLLSNAVKYSPENEQITVSAVLLRDRTMQDRAGGGSGQAMLVVSITDKGMGIDPAEHEKIFQSFYRTDNPATRKASGVGLGLYICRAYVEAMHGRIWVNSAVGQGATFSFSLQVADVKGEASGLGASQQGSEAVFENGEKTRASVLVVDDEPYVLKASEVNLRASGFEVTTVSSGEEALALIEQGRPDLIVLDILMGGISGLEVARRLRDQESTRDVPIVFVSAKAQEIEQLEALNAGGDYFMKKPFSPSVLCAVVGETLGLDADGRRQRRQEAIRALETKVQQSEEKRAVI